jgi:flagellar motility protein MotE (MotC chaperone)
MEEQMSDKTEKRFNEATALLDRFVEQANVTKRFLERTWQDMDELAGKLHDLEDEYDMLMANWVDEDEGGEA